jgi:hypothetical protein
VTLTTAARGKPPARACASGAARSSRARPSARRPAIISVENLFYNVQRA